jgi:hypothetical protein
MRKKLSLILPLLIFLPVLFYLHQKVQIYIEGYRLSNTFRYHKELIDKRDYLMYNFAEQATLAKVNQWASLKDFAPVDKERVMALGIKKQAKSSSGSKMVSLLDRVLKASSPTLTALAKERR